jgi:hypothetical protein
MFCSKCGLQNVDETKFFRGRRPFLSYESAGALGGKSILKGCTCRLGFSIKTVQRDGGQFLTAPVGKPPRGLTNSIQPDRNERASHPQLLALAVLPGG